MTETPNNKSRKTEWTKEKSEKLASDITKLKNSAIKLRDSVIKQPDIVLEVPDSIDGMRFKSQELLEIAAQQEQENEARKAEIAEANRKSDEWLEESNRRFYTLLEEVRSYRRDRIDGESQ
ncbi:hypothetical protein [Argonema antarcticum]|uniref:hypothetical protein n=1 Tax=Argonema antarcticum TaxID=2942763 RepID=UPI0020130625|nr:hypothetical protein [Argonema antarcticum]MCL1475405.1 hypothetical protein [Argonema antarcticum A004/B2]